MVKILLFLFHPILLVIASPNIILLLFLLRILVPPLAVAVNL